MTASTKSKPNVLVTGGAGFVGSALTKLLLQKNTRVTIFDNFSFGRKNHVWPGIRLIQGDLRSKRAMKKAVDRSYDMVFHLAALHFIPYCNKHPKKTIAVNVLGTQELLETLCVRNPKKLFFASTAAVYDTSSRFHKETDLPQPMDIYGISKLAGEHLINQFHKQTYVPCAIGRLFNAYGPRETNDHLIPHILKQLKAGKRTLQLGNLSPYRDYIHTSDMSALIYRAIQKLTTGFKTVNIASGKEYSVRQVVKILSQVLGERIQVKSTKKLQRKSERSHLRADLRELKKWTGISARTSFEDGLRNLLLEYRVALHEGRSR